MRLRLLLWVSFALLVFASPALALPLPVRVLDTQYSVELRANTEPLATSRTTTSPSPLADTLLEGALEVAYAAAAQFQVDVRTSFDYLDGIPSKAFAGARSVLAFSPLSDGIATLDFAFIGHSQARWSDGFVRLEDLTTAELLWDYGWACCLLLPPIWPGDGQDYNASAALAVQQALDATHAYRLTLYTDTASSGDQEGMSIHVSGLEAVPEPSAPLLTALGMLALGGMGIRRNG